MTTTVLYAPSSRSRLRELVLFSSVLLLGSCSTIRTTSDPGFRIHPGDTYAWVRTEPPELSDGEDVPLEEFRQAIEGEFSTRGIQQVAADQATFLVQARLGVKEVETHDYDPDLELYSSEKHEEGSLYFELLAGSTRRTMWTGECRHRLRYLARTRSGDSSGRWEPTGEARSWRVEPVVARIFQRLPMADSAGDVPDAGDPMEAVPKEHRP